MRRGTEHFPHVVATLEELPEPVYQACHSSVTPADIRKIVLIPPQEYFFTSRQWRDKLSLKRRKTPQRTLLFSDTHISVVEETTPIQMLDIPLAGVVALDMVTVLLYSSLECAWLQDNQIQTALFEFNSVGAKLIEHELAQVKSFISTQYIGLPSTQRHDAAAIQALPLKFCNYTRLSLLPGEQVWHTTYEPAIRQSGQRFRQYLAPNRVFLLTDYHLIILADALPNWRGDSQSPYQIEQHYYPRQHIQRLTFDRQEDDLTWLTLSLGTAQAQRDIRLPLSEARAADLQAAAMDWLPVGDQPVVRATVSA